MDHPHGPSGQRSPNRRGLYPIRGEGSATLAVPFAGFSFGLPGISQQVPKQHLAQFAFREIFRLG